MKNEMAQKKMKSCKTNNWILEKIIASLWVKDDHQISGEIVSYRDLCYCVSLRTYNLRDADLDPHEI